MTAGNRAALLVAGLVTKQRMGPAGPATSRASLVMIMRQTRGVESSFAGACASWRARLPRHTEPAGDKPRATQKKKRGTGPAPHKKEACAEAFDTAHASPQRLLTK